MDPFIPGKIVPYFPGDTYVSPDRTPGLMSRLFPSLMFYTRVYLETTRWISARTKKNVFDKAAQCYACSWCAENCEKTGLNFHILGMDNLDPQNGPCVIVANHMSTLETFLLPAILIPRFPATFVVKRSLVEMRGFGPVLAAYNPVIVDRKNPREDLATVLKEGCDRLANGISVVVFPQATRSDHFDESHFNTIGIKLARKAGVPVIPLALKTDAWGQGRLVRELGPIHPQKDVYMRFFPPMTITGSGHAEHKLICSIISQHVAWWEQRQKAKDEGRNLPPLTDPSFELPY
ncbi:MAG: lysophospholipid acyltransferase family protein [Desulfovibrionaceae bacterium]|nr:lysophospholipid acyltransferase family protein [Desulfovibrionaceae bacterium]